MSILICLCGVCGAMPLAGPSHVVAWECATNPGYPWRPLRDRYAITGWGGGRLARHDMSRGGGGVPGAMGGAAARALCVSQSVSALSQSIKPRGPRQDSMILLI